MACLMAQAISTADRIRGEEVSHYIASNWALAWKLSRLFLGTSDCDVGRVDCAVRGSLKAGRREAFVSWQ